MIEPWRKWLAVVVALLLLLGGQTVAFIAYAQSNHTANCVNDILGSRNAPSTNDSDSQIAFAVAIDRLLAPGPGTDAEKLARFRAAVRRHIAVLEASQATRAAHPLGLC